MCSWYFFGHIAAIAVDLEMVEKPPKLIFKENYGEAMDFGYHTYGFKLPEARRVNDHHPSYECQDLLPK